MGKLTICNRRKQRRRSVTAKLISAFVFATRGVLFIFYLYPKFLALCCDCTVWFVSDLVGNSNCRFSHIFTSTILVLLFSFVKQNKAPMRDNKDTKKPQPQPDPPSID